MPQLALLYLGPNGTTVKPGQMPTQHSPTKPMPAKKDNAFPVCVNSSTTKPVAAQAKFDMLPLIDPNHLSELPK